MMITLTRFRFSVGHSVTMMVSWILGLGLLSGALAPRALALAGSRNFDYTEPSAQKKLTLAAYGDSIVAGYCGVNCTQDSYVQFYTYLNSNSTAVTENASIVGWIRGVSGQVASQIYDDMVKDVSEIEQADILTLEACGNDYINGRKDYQNMWSGHYCDGTRLDSAVADCKKSISSSIDYLVDHAKPGALIRVMNIYYPGFNDDGQKNCSGKSDADRFLSVILGGNWYTCDYAWRKGVPCVDAFADFNASDDDRDKIAWVAGESYQDYLFRVSVLNRDVITDPTQKPHSDGSVENLLIDDNTHPNASGHARLGLLHHLVGYQH